MDWQATASTSGVSGGTAALIGLYTGANSGAFKTVMSAGTDTTTATTASMADIVTPASPIRDSNTFSFTNIGLSMAGIQWQGNFLAGSFGVGGTTAIGEFGLEVRMFGSVGSVYIWALMNRLAVADANTGFTSPINVSNTNPFNITITLVI